MSQPLVLTLQLDEAAQAFYEGLRRLYFPPERNVIPAHLSLFHQLPDQRKIHETLHALASVTPAFPLTNPVLRSIGRGVAVFVGAKALMDLHAALSSEFEVDLIPQDRQRFRPHIVVQNKVDPETARQTLSQLQSTPMPEPRATGLTLWRYLGGPWQRLHDFSFHAGDAPCQAPLELAS